MRHDLFPTIVNEICLLSAHKFKIAGPVNCFVARYCADRQRKIGIGVGIDIGIEKAQDGIRTQETG